MSFSYDFGKGIKLSEKGITFSLVLNNMKSYNHLLLTVSSLNRKTKRGQNND